MHTCRTIIFDLDGVICFTDRYHYLAWKALADRLNIPFDEKANQALRGIGRMESLDILLSHGDQTFSPEEKAAFAEDKNATYRTMLAAMTPDDLAPETRSTLEALKKLGYLLAIGSSSKNTKFILERLGLSEFFDAVADGTDITRSKPDPEVFLCAASKTGTPPAECAVIEDARSGIQAAKAAGMLAAALHGDAEHCGMEDINLTNFSDLLTYFKGGQS